MDMRERGALSGRLYGALWFLEVALAAVHNKHAESKAKQSKKKGH